MDNSMAGQTSVTDPLGSESELAWMLAKGFQDTTSGFLWSEGAA